MDVTLEMLLNHFGISLTEDFCHRLRQPHMLFGRIYGNNQINDCKIDVKHLEPFFFHQQYYILKASSTFIQFALSLFIMNVCLLLLFVHMLKDFILVL